MSQHRNMALACGWAAVVVAGCNAPYDYDVPIVHPDADTGTDTGFDLESDTWVDADVTDVPEEIDTVEEDPAGEDAIEEDPAEEDTAVDALVDPDTDTFTDPALDDTFVDTEWDSLYDPDPDTVEDPDLDTLYDPEWDSLYDPEWDTIDDSDADTPFDPDATTDGDCAPDCAGRVCGPDPACGASCGTCGADSFCDGSGQCAARWVTVAAGTFTMGSPVAEPGRDTDETEHAVTITRDFLMKATEVTQDEFLGLMGYDPSSLTACGGDCPVENVNWHEAADYTNALSASQGLPGCYSCTGSGASVVCSPSATYATPYDCTGYRLPTEAEWEHAARAGTTGGTYNGTSTLLACETPNAILDPIAWFCGNSGSTTHPAGDRDPSAPGLYDILGNVQEWCHDWFDAYPTAGSTDPSGPTTGGLKVMRGGSWEGNAARIRSADRIAYVADSRYRTFGLRPVRTLPTGDWVRIPAGAFTMGSPASEPGRDPAEIEHTVTLTYDFLMKATEVTQDEYEALMGYDPSSFTGCGGSCPVENLNWHESAAYANALSAAQGLPACYTCSGSGPGVTCSPSVAFSLPFSCTGFRLPTEAEWEYAARAGTTEATYNGTSSLALCETPNAVLDPIAWFCGNSGGAPQAIGTLGPNAWGIYDALGDVYEWCSDWSAAYGGGSATNPWGGTTGTERILRGGSWRIGAGGIRAAARYQNDPGYRYYDFGFRLVRTVP